MLVPSKHFSTVGRDKALLTYAIVKEYKFNGGKVIENSVLESSYHKAITHLPLITKLYKVVGEPTGENEEKSPLMQPLHFPKKKTTRLMRRNIPRRDVETREEREGREEENQAKAEASDIEEKEIKREPLQDQIGFMVERMTGMASVVYEEFVDCWEGNYHLHRDNDSIFARMDALAHRQEIQVQREEANT